MVLIRIAALFALILIVSVGFGPEVDAHKNRQQAAPENLSPSIPSADAASRVNTLGAMQPMMEDHAEAMEAAQPRSFGGRLMRFLGQMHPFAVHFPIALFPVSWLALIFARRRQEAVGLIRAFIIVAGASSFAAGILGWLSGGLPCRMPIRSSPRIAGSAQR